MFRQNFNSSPDTNFLNENATLKLYINNIRLSSEGLSKAQDCSKKIIDTLKTYSKGYGIDVDRVKIVGSFIKQTYMDGSDIDLTVFVNNAYSPFDDILLKFKSILRSQLGIWNIVSKKILLSLQMDNFKFDILPATNFDDGIDLNSQLTGTLKYIHSHEVVPVNCSYKYGAGWSEYITNFVGKKSQFILDVIILARKWIKGITFTHKHIPALSYMTELLVIYANRGKDESYLRNGFLRFLECMANFNTLNVEFDDYKSLHKNIGLKTLDFKLPKIIDPINVWHNLANKIYPQNILKIMSAASFTSNELKKGANLLKLLSDDNYNYA